jgi:hypothetical protein
VNQLVNQSDRKLCERNKSKPIRSVLERLYFVLAQERSFSSRTRVRRKKVSMSLDRFLVSPHLRPETAACRVEKDLNRRRTSHFRTEGQKNCSAGWSGTAI